jgi:hypothetical protein
MVLVDDHHVWTVKRRLQTLLTLRLMLLLRLHDVLYVMSVVIRHHLLYLILMMLVMFVVVEDLSSMSAIMGHLSIYWVNDIQQRR